MSGLPPRALDESLDQAIEEVLEETLSLARLDGVLRAVGISGSPRSPSKSKAMLQRMMDSLARYGAETKVIDVATLPAEALVARESAQQIDDAVAAIGQADIIVASSPTYRALYTGALKCFFDLLPQGHLADKVCIGLQTGVAAEHSLAAEYGFRPLFASLQGIPMAVVYATDAEFEDGEPNAALRERLRNVADSAVTSAG
jgi:FMN reductase